MPNTCLTPSFSRHLTRSWATFSGGTPFFCASDRTSGRLFFINRLAHHRGAVSALRDGLAHVLWIGGAPRVGKTTLSRLLAGKYDLKLYNIDWHLVREHRTRLDPVRHPTAIAWEKASLDDQWVSPSVGDFIERGIKSWTETFDLVLEDLARLPS